MPSGAVHPNITIPDLRALARERGGPPLRPFVAAPTSLARRFDRGQHVIVKEISSPLAKEMPEIVTDTSNALWTLRRAILTKTTGQEGEAAVR
jgi:hypothetical protein